MMRIAGKFEMSKRRRSAESGKFVDKATADANPNTTVIETISPTADLIRHVREFVNSDGEDFRSWQVTFSNDLARILDRGRLLLAMTF
jgi:hypothetical protein